MIFYKLMEVFAYFINLLADALPSLDTSGALANYAMLARWFHSFDVLFPMSTVTTCLQLTFAATFGMTVVRVMLFIINVVRGAGA